MNYIATFYTQAAALLTNRALKKHGVQSKAGPVPRELSSSCGTCVHYTADAPMLEVLDEDLESVYEKGPSGYKLLLHHE
ncbi:MAG: DUF3343 domain-containing protein [Clostridia bacterium]|nr:DUF3343 domain-containing protein [Clostridia bacterium]